MTVEEVREKALKIIPAIGRELKLAMWEIDLTVEEEDPEGLGYQGVVQAYDEYEKAHIVLYAENIDDDAELVRVLIHEMTHVLIAPVFRMIEMNNGLGELLGYAAEKTTLRVERVLNALGLYDRILAELGGEHEAATTRASEQPEV